MHFTKLRLSGFKSFVDTTELLIEPGLTGVVGPNGCGKSNLVEALRWVMGENSARRMRGGEMDDVIFAGSSDRPARNVAEVMVAMDNSAQQATPPFQNMETLEIARRIERQSGSSYRINGRDVRARDVQLLFADAGTGAQSNGLVSQGRVSAIINAKPGERRKLLEEAAGISGLHSRRHEAELKLKGAEANLERLDDVIQTMEVQLKHLQSQARHAAKYRRLQTQIRESEALYLYLKWQKAQNLLQEAEYKYRGCENAVAELAGQQAHAAKHQTEAAIILPDLRKAEAEAGAAYQRLINARTLLDSEEQRLAEQQRELQNQIQQIHQDQQREKEVQLDAENEFERFATEKEELVAAAAEEEALHSDQQDHLSDLLGQLQDAEHLLSENTRQLMQDQAQSDSLRQTLSDLGQRILRQQQRLQLLHQEKTSLSAQTDDVEKYQQAQEEILILEEHQAEIEESVEILAAKTQQQAEKQQTQSEIFHQKRNKRDQLSSEMRGLEKLVQQQMGQQGKDQATQSVLVQSTVQAGYEAAFGAVMSDAVNAPLLKQAPAADHGWGYLPILASDPDWKYPCLADYVQGPEELSRFLRFCYIVSDASQAQQIWEQLAPGMILVSLSGDIWRWDGYCRQAGQHSQAASIFLEQRNRLNELQDEYDQAEEMCQQAQADLTDLQKLHEECQQAEKAERTQLQTIFQKMTQARKESAHLADRVRQIEAKIASQTDLIHQAEQDLTDLLAQQEILEGQTAELPDLAERKQGLAQDQEKLDQLRQTVRLAQSQADRLKQEAASRERRIQELSTQLAGWDKRRVASRERVQEFEARLEGATEMLENLAERPEEIAEQREILFEQIALSEGQKRQAGDQLAEAETRQRETQAVLKEVEAHLATAREDRARAEGGVAQAKLALQTFVDRIFERLSCRPEQTLETVGLTEDQLGAQLDDQALEQRIQKLSQDRENMGAVNLRAEQEVEEMGARIEALTSEREDLVEAISRLRQGIQTLNREARDRLNKAFDAVNQSFETLFVKMFGGGHAHLSLTDPQDPLNTGLEIMASPPGKKLQIMSLLSGGEQALTALALIFAVFQSNPAPICVLDEVDAPLDDANVDRFCTLIEEMAAGGETRFLVVTHHRMTMARVHRLFGVTMRERGISQLVSVDLQQAGALVD